MSKLTVTALSDTHNFHEGVVVPPADVLMFAGDFMTTGYKHSEVKSFIKWLAHTPARYKLLVYGNHDRMAENSPEYIDEKIQEQGDSGISVLNDSGITIEGINFWGSPVQPEFGGWAFNVKRGAPIKKHWDLIPENTDVLITHGPPYGMLDQSHVAWANMGPLGCEELRKRVGDLPQLKCHVFGHIHDSYGSLPVIDKDGKIVLNFHNVAICNEEYQPVNRPHIFEVTK